MGACATKAVKFPPGSPCGAISERQLEEFREAFNTFDKDGGGSIDATELKDLMESVGSNPTDDEIAEMIAMADADGSGSIDFAEFVTLMAHNMAAGEKSPESVAAAFSVFDSDGGGSISAVEMQRILMNVGEPITTEDVEKVINKIDQDGSGEIEIAEFTDFILQGAKQPTPTPTPTPTQKPQTAIAKPTGGVTLTNGERYTSKDPPVRRV